MELLSFIQRRFSRANGHAQSKLQGMQSSDEMERSLVRERARADRNGIEFSLVVFKIEESSTGSLPAWLLGGATISRARATDEIGWFDESDVAALLPDTCPVGARCFAESVCTIVDGKIRKPSYVIYSYPSGDARDDRPESLGDRGSGNRGADARRARRSPQPAEVSAVAAAPQPPAPSPAAMGGPDGPTRDLQILLVQPIARRKRLFDIACSLGALILLSPVLLATAIAVKTTSAGPAIFRQRRAGLGGRAFTIYKYRTMVIDAEAQKHKLMRMNEQDGPAFKIKNDPRLTRIGRFLRRTSIDELPQLWNVLKGDMTFVGPRPLPCNETARCEPWQRRRLDVTPGLTCTWQVHARSRVSFADWVRMDIAYISDQSPRRDLKLLLQTIPAVILGKGAH